MHLPAIETENVQFQHLKIILVGRNVQKFLCVLNAMRRNTLQIINNKIHQKRKKTKKWWKHHMKLNSWSPKFRQKLNIKRDKINLFDPCAMGLYCEIRGRIESLTLVGHLPRKISLFCKHFWKYNGDLDATVRSTKLRVSPLPQWPSTNWPRNAHQALGCKRKNSSQKI